jgi:hypothetical protein
VNKFFILLANFGDLKQSLKKISLFSQEKFYRLEMILKDVLDEL